MTKKELENLISNCNAVNERKCEYCRRNKTCKEYNELLEIATLEAEVQKMQDDWEKKHRVKEIKL